MKNKLWLKIFSVLFAVLAWTYVNLQNTNQIERTVPLVVSFVNEPENIRVSKPQELVTKVKLSGTRKDFMFAKFTKRYANAQINLRYIKPGSFQIPIDILNLYPGLKFVSAKPDTYKIDAQEVIQKKFPLTVEIKGELEDGYLAGEPSVKPEEIILRGDSKDVSMVTACYVAIDYNKKTNSISQSLPVELRFKNDYKPQNESISKEPPNVQVIVSVKHGFPTKKIKVNAPVFVGDLKDGRKLISFDFYPKDVEISGPKRALNSISVVNIGKIDLSNVQSPEKPIMAVLETLPQFVNLVGSPTVTLNLTVTDPVVPKAELSSEAVILTPKTTNSEPDIVNDKPKETENGN